MGSRASDRPFGELEPQAKRPKLDGDSQTSRTGQLVELNPADCNLDFTVEENGLQGHALYDGGFAYCWSGARATFGITGGKYCYGCKIISNQSVDMEDTPPDQQHVCRVGISRGDDDVGKLGESEHSFGYGGTGKFSSAGKFCDYGMKFGIGDTIVCSVDLKNKPMATIGFSKNGQWLGTAQQFDAGPAGLQVTSSPMEKLTWESAMFPHVLLKNVVVQVQFSIEDGLVPEEGYKPWNCAIEDGNAIAGPSFPSPTDCEVIMMVGLPASGKSTWAEKWARDHTEKRYVLLGTNLALDQMKVPGLIRRHNYGERFDRLMDRATGIFNTLLARASKTPRNYILDQTNVYKSARKRKMKTFINYHKIAVVVFPTPDELKNRADKRFKDMGKEVPAETVNEMLAHFVLPMSKDMPGTDELFDEVLFTELNREDSQRYLDEMKSELRTSREFTPYSRRSSVGSFSSYHQPNVSVTGTSACAPLRSLIPLPDPDFQYCHQVRSHSYPQSHGMLDRPSVGHQSDFYASNCGVSTGDTSGNNSKYRSAFPQDGSCSSYRGSDPYDASRFTYPSNSSYDVLGGHSSDYGPNHQGLPSPHRPPFDLQSYPVTSASPLTHSYGDFPHVDQYAGSPYRGPPPRNSYGQGPPTDGFSGPGYGTPPRCPYPFPRGGFSGLGRGTPPAHPYGDRSRGGRFAGSPYGVEASRLQYGDMPPVDSFAGYRGPPPRNPHGDLPAATGHYSVGYSSYQPPNSGYY